MIISVDKVIAISFHHKRIMKPPVTYLVIAVWLLSFLLFTHKLLVSVAIHQNSAIKYGVCSGSIIEIFLVYLLPHFVVSGVTLFLNQ